MEQGHENRNFYHKSSCHMRNDNTNWGMVNEDGKIVIFFSDLVVLDVGHFGRIYP